MQYSGSGLREARKFKLASHSIIDFVVPDPIKVKIDDFIDNIETQTWHRLAKLSWMPFEEARANIHSLNLQSIREWRSYCLGRMAGKMPKPQDIPSDASHVYADKGWINWGDWLGTGTVAPQLRQYLPFNQARQFSRSLNLSSRTEWKEYCKDKIPNMAPRPEDIPISPIGVYSDKGWIGWGDWLGTDAIAPRLRHYRLFEKARVFSRSLNLKSHGQWRAYSKGEIPSLPPKPDDIPTDVYSVYADKGWIGWGDWLGTDVVASQNRAYMPFKQARQFSRSLNLKNRVEWKSYCKGKMPDKEPKPEDIPASPFQTYADKGWINWGDWLGTGTVAPRYRQFIIFKQARAFAHSLNLNGQVEWQSYCKGEIPDKEPKPEDVPSNPYQTYADKGWISWADWLGKE